MYCKNCNKKVKGIEGENLSFGIQLICEECKEILGVIVPEQ